MSRRYERDDPIADAHDHANRDVAQIEVCEHCHKPIYSWEDYYDVDGETFHEDCALGWLRKYKKYS